MVQSSVDFAAEAETETETILRRKSIAIGPRRRQDGAVVNRLGAGTFPKREMTINGRLLPIFGDSGITGICKSRVQE